LGATQDHSYRGKGTGAKKEPNFFNCTGKGGITEKRDPSGELKGRGGSKGLECRSFDLGKKRYSDGFSSRRTKEET